MPRLKPTSAFERGASCDVAGEVAGAIAGDGALRDLPVRPDIPLALVLAVAIWVADAAMMQLTPNLSAAQCGIACAIGLAGAVACVVVLLARGGTAVATAALGAALGVACAASCSMQLHAGMQLAQLEGAGERRFFVVEDSSEGDFGASCMARTTLQDGTEVTVRLNLPDATEVPCWTTLTATGSIRAPSEQARSYYWSKGAVGSVSARNVRVVRTGSVFEGISDARERCAAVLDGEEGDGAALMKAVLFGKRSDLFSRSVYVDVKSVGLAHIVAVSGAHLSIIVSFVTMLLQRAGVPRRALVPVIAVFVVSYVVFTGAPQSAVRAAIMTACAVASFFARRKSAALSALGLCVVIVLVCDPLVAVSTSFALSAGATLGIVLFGRYFSLWFLELLGGHARGVADVLGVTFASNVFTIPVSVPLFGQLPLVSPLANLVVAPVFSVLCVGGVVGTTAGLAVPMLAASAAFVLATAGQLVCEAVHLLAQVPFACIPATGSLPVMMAVAAGLSALLWLWWPEPSRALAACGVLSLCLAGAGMLVVFPALHGDEIVMLDVGQGDAILVRTGSHALLVDTGTNDSQVLAGLARHDVTHLDAVLVTHPDDDHCGSLPAVLGAVSTDRVLVARDLIACDTRNCEVLRGYAEGSSLVGLDAGDEFRVGHFSMRVLSPESFRDGGGNMDSIVMTAECDCDSDGQADATALLTGDAESEVLDPLAQAGALPHVDILKQPHHGSSGGATDDVLAALRPAISLISCGEANRYGHPHDETLELLDAWDVAPYRTDLQGDVVCKLGTESITVTTQR